MKRWRPPTRPLILIALLLAGAVVNVAVAWGITAAANIADSTRHMSAEPPNWLAPIAPEMPVFQSGPGWGHARIASDSMVVVAGFPCYSLRTVRSGLTFPGVLQWSWPPPAAPITERGVQAPRFLRARGWLKLSHGYLPTEPVLPGFAINTLFYAAVLGAILALPLSFFPIRRRVRARRGRCRRCNYDLTGLEQCPECGL